MRASPNSYNVFFKGLAVLLSTWPIGAWPASGDSNKWQNIVVTIYERTLQAKGRLETKIEYWSAAEKLLKELSRLGAIPPSVAIPNTKCNTLMGESATAPLGYQTKKIKIAVTPEDILPKKFMIEQDLDKPDDLYLSQFREELEENSRKVSEALKGYWKEMLSTHELGKNLIDSLAIEEQQFVFLNNGYDQNGEHVCSSSNPNALSWFLALIKHKFESGKIKAISVNELTRSSFGLSRIRLLELFADAKAICPSNYINSTHSNEYVARLIGLLSVIDCHAAISLLIINNPVLTAEGVAFADLYMENGDCYVQVDSEKGQVRFSVSKPRALDRKVTHFNQISRHILSTIIDCTSSLRALLLKSQNRNWRRMFLYVNARGVAYRPDTITNSENDKSSLKARLAVDLVSIRKPFSLAPTVLRATQGIITFLRTGSLAITSMVLGNSIYVTQSNYVPRWLVRRFANRTHRILSQKIIVVATHGHPWALAASDFLTPEQLHRFIVRILEEATGNDPFAVVARKKLSDYAPETSRDTRKKGELHLRVHSEILAALYSYENKVTNMKVDEQVKIHPETNLSHQAICNIAKLLRLAAELEIDTASEADLQIALSFGGNALEELKFAHQQALEQLPYYDSIFINIQPPL
ncbi:hypothetical protein ACJ70E_08295 [Pseudomonas plecoglossicida]|uniref:hypothetical protein n=1 Tax=Pseudomonas plecoglossicida TaxID=70775 RepID=UPI00397787DD